MNIILDSSIIIRYPKILGIKLPDTIFLTPLDVILELNSYSSNKNVEFGKRVELIEKAAREGYISIVNSAGTIRQYQEVLTSTAKVSGSDIALLALALNLQNKDEEVAIATLDRAIEKYASENGIKILGAAEIENMILKFLTENSTGKPSSLQTEIVSFETREKRNLLLGVGLGITITLLTTLVYQHIQSIISTVNVWGTVIAAILLSILLFAIREKQRLAYGVFEFTVGIAAIILLFTPASFNFSSISFDINFNIKLLGGLYIMVRGQDNIVKGLKNTKAGFYLRDKLGIGL